MKQTLALLLTLFTLVACDQKQPSINDYTKVKVKFGKSKFTSSNGEFSIMLPKGDWFVNEDTVNSDTLLYIMESGQKELSKHNFMVFGIAKSKVIHGNIDTEFDTVIQEFLGRVSNLNLIEKSNLKIGTVEAKTAHLAYEYEDKVIQEEIDIFIPYGQNQYYYLSMISNKNEHLDNNFGMLLECAKTFKLEQ